MNVFIIGDSYGRDWGNVLLESKFSKGIFISYIHNSELGESLNATVKNRIKNADLIFWSTILKEELEKYNLEKNDLEKIWCVGTKNYGLNIGFFYNYKGKAYCDQRTKMEKGYLKFNNELRNQWGEKFIDLIGPVSDDENMVPVFTPNCKFISQDCLHFTKPGAEYFALILEDQLSFLKEKIDEAKN